MALRQLRIVLVEDNPSDAELITQALRRSASYDFEVVVCPSLKSATETVTEDSPDAVLLDLGLPDSSGVHSVREILRKTPNLPVVVLTGNDDDETALHSLQNGAQDYLVKGRVDTDNLSRSIRYAVERSRLEQERKELEWQMLGVIRHEQYRIGRELHDGLGQELTGLSMMAKSLARKLPQRMPDEAQTAELLAAGIQHALTTARHVIQGLNPVDVDAQGLVVALRRLCELVRKQSSVECSLNHDSCISVHDNQTATHLYRIAQECINNALKHADPKHITLELLRHGSRVLMQIRDDGSGFETQDKYERGNGFRFMRHRCALIGAALEVHSTPQTGTIIRCLVENKSRI